MPIIKSAIKKLRQDNKRTVHNRQIKDAIKRAIKNAQAKKTAQSVKTAISLVNRAVKKHIYHKNKSARLTSNLAKLLNKKTEIKKATKKKVEKKPVKS